MKLTLQQPAKALSKAYLKQSLKREQIEQFKANLVRLFDRIREEEHEEHLKNIVADFLMRGGRRSYGARFIKYIPIPTATPDQQPPIIDRVQQIFAAPTAPAVPRLEAEIDRLVYALYNLTDEEITIVEGRK